MSDTTDAATPNEEPTGNDEPNGDEGTATDESGTTYTPEAFKGLQRNISAKDAEIQRLKAQVGQTQSQGMSQGMSEQQLVALLRPVLTRLQEVDPDAARSAAEQMRTAMLEYQNKQYQSQFEQNEQRRQFDEAESRAMDQLRGIAADLGADPDSPLIDYGNPTQWLQDRMALVRETAKQAAAPATPKAKPDTNQANGTAHNANPGVPPSAASTSKTSYTQADYDEAARQQAQHPSKANLSKMMEIRNALREQMEASLAS